MLYNQLAFSLKELQLLFFYFDTFIHTDKQEYVSLQQGKATS